MHFVIAGRINCPQFSYAVMVAQRLKENLPDFTYLKIPKRPEEWERWLLNVCKENEWYHIKSPIIWREFGMKNGKRDFIGDINKFFDLCYDYYGIPREMLAAENFNKGEIEWFKNRTESEFFESIQIEAKRKREYRSRQVCITGACSRVAEVIVMELLQLDIQKRENGLEIRLFDEPSKDKKLASAANDAKHCPGPSGFGNCRVVYTLKEALLNIDLVIVLDSFPRRPKETLVKWLKRNRNAMCALGKALNRYAPPHCRVIIGSPSSQPICYNATVLASYATKLHVRNIVAVTQDLGREMLRVLSKKVNTPLRDFYCPPVWGFVGLNKFIDVQKTLQTHLYELPGKRLNSTIPQGDARYELRTSECLISEDETNELNVSLSRHKTKCFPQIGRTPCLAKATAILDLLKVWGLKQEDGNGEILSLGVYSDGTFNIPKGIYWSQPVVLKDGFWVPFADFPIPRSNIFDCYYLFMYTVAAVYRTKVKPRIYIPPKKLQKSKEKQKFNFDGLVEEIGMPVIRTDSECVIYLKYLAKKELGIDLDFMSEDIEEEEDEPVVLPEVEVPPKQIYCECWRQELKELQKIVFDRSSTTEIEVDLSDNISGSEWSVNNLEGQSEVSVQGSEMLDKGIARKPLKPFAPFAVKDQTISSSESSASVVCSCEASGSTGSICRCLAPTTEKKEVEEEVSTEHYYKQQNAEVFNDEDTKDVIYVDTYEMEKHVTFDASTKHEDDVGSKLKFYGKKDAVRDKDAELKMRKRILRYEKGGEESTEGEGEDKSFAGEGGKSSLDVDEVTDSQDRKFQKKVEGASFETVGDQDGREPSAERKKIGDSETSCTDDDALKIVTSVVAVPSDAEKSWSSTSRQDSSVIGEDRLMGLRSMTGEMEGEYCLPSWREELDALWDEGLFHVESEKDEESYEKSKKRKWEGIPLCSLCRCIVPEGLPCCPCGATTVVEVFKKESVEIFIQAEDEMSYRVEYFKSDITSETGESELSLENMSGEDVQVMKALPPESFLPFSPAPINQFRGSVRPSNMTKEYAYSVKTKTEISPMCSKLLNLAKAELEAEAAVEEEEEGGGGTEERKSMEDLEEDKENLPPACRAEEMIKTDFSNLKMFIPCGLEDWRLTVQKKYREWFFQGSKTKDDAYYDIAIEEVSEDEFEVDKEMEQYFES